MVDYMDHSFILQHSGYRIVTVYRWVVDASLAKIRKFPSQSLASAPYLVLEGSTMVFG